MKSGTSSSAVPGNNNSARKTSAVAGNKSSAKRKLAANPMPHSTISGCSKRKHSGGSNTTRITKPGSPVVTLSLGQPPRLAYLIEGAIYTLFLACTVFFSG